MKNIESLLTFLNFMPFFYMFLHIKDDERGIFFSHCFIFISPSIVFLLINVHPRINNVYPLTTIPCELEEKALLALLMSVGFVA